MDQHAGAYFFRVGPGLTREAAHATALFRRSVGNCCILWDPIAGGSGPGNEFATNLPQGCNRNATVMQRYRDGLPWDQWIADSAGIVDVR